MATFAEHLSRLFATVYPSGRGPYTLLEVCQAIDQEGVVSVSPSYLSQLRAGQKANPAASTVAAIARFFRVSTDYFFDDELADRVNRDIDYLAVLRDAGVRSIAERSLGLTPDSRETVASLIESLRRAEGLPAVGFTKRPKDEKH